MAESQNGAERRFRYGKYFEIRTLASFFTYGVSRRNMAWGRNPSEGWLHVQVGRYQILETLGTGANSRVVRGFDPLIDRAVAIKLLSPELSRGEARTRFLREARVVGKLSHPFIITLHDMGIEESTSTPYLVMELVGRAIARENSYERKRAVSIGMRLGSAGGSGAECAHRHGIIHGDVKPANILVTSDGRTKLTDFGNGAAFEPRYEGYFPAGDAGVLVPGADYGGGRKMRARIFFRWECCSTKC